MHEFDVAIIGSGPTAVAALQGLENSRRRIGIITGASPTVVPLSRLHPKIQAVAAARDEVPGFAEIISQANGLGRPLLSTAAVGGLTNYWGQQFVRFAAGDPWPPQLFENYADYEGECDAIEKLFCLTGGETLGIGLAVSDGFRARVPRLLMGTAENPTADLAAVREVFGALKERTGAIAFQTLTTSRI